MPLQRAPCASARHPSATPAPETQGNIDWFRRHEFCTTAARPARTEVRSPGEPSAFANIHETCQPLQAGVLEQVCYLDTARKLVLDGLVNAGQTERIQVAFEQVHRRGELSVRNNTLADLEQPK